MSCFRMVLVDKAVFIIFPNVTLMFLNAITCIFACFSNILLRAITTIYDPLAILVGLKQYHGVNWGLIT